MAPTAAPIAIPTMAPVESLLDEGELVGDTGEVVGFVGLGEEHCWSAERGSTDQEKVALNWLHVGSVTLKSLTTQEVQSLWLQNKFTVAMPFVEITLAQDGDPVTGLFRNWIHCPSVCFPKLKVVKGE